MRIFPRTPSSTSAANSITFPTDPPGPPNKSPHESPKSNKPSVHTTSTPQKPSKHAAKTTTESSKIHPLPSAYIPGNYLPILPNPSTQPPPNTPNHPSPDVDSFPCSYHQTSTTPPKTTPWTTNQPSKYVTVPL